MTIYLKPEQERIIQAEIKSGHRGAHVLRHSAATAMLRNSCKAMAPAISTCDAPLPTNRLISPLS